MRAARMRRHPRLTCDQKEPAFESASRREPLMEDRATSSACRTVRAERMPKDMPAAKLLPLASGKCPFKVVVGFVALDWLDRNPMTLAADYGPLAERMFASYVRSQPLLHYLSQQRGHRHAAGRE